jgi:hypothetical protein
MKIVLILQGEDVRMMVMVKVAGVVVMCEMSEGSGGLFLHQ